MAHINLLPWRDDRRKQREHDFYAKLGMAFVLAIVVIIVWAGWNSSRISNQNDRNAYLQNQIRQVKTKIAKIKNLEKVRDRLLARKKIIEQLQSNRSQMVHLFDELVKTIPDSVRLTSMTERDELVKSRHELVKHLTLKGVAQSNASVADYMENLEASPWFASPKLSGTNNSHEGSRMPYTFGLSVTLSTPTEKEMQEQKEAEAKQAKSEPATAASVAKPAKVAAAGPAQADVKPAAKSAATPAGATAGMGGQP